MANLSRTSLKGSLWIYFPETIRSQGTPVKDAPRQPPPQRSFLSSGLRPVDWALTAKNVERERGQTHPLCYIENGGRGQKPPSASVGRNDLFLPVDWLHISQRSCLWLATSLMGASLKTWKREKGLGTFLSWVSILGSMVVNAMGRLFGLKVQFSCAQTLCWCIFG